MTVGSDGDGGDGRMDVRMGQLLLLVLAHRWMEGGGYTVHRLVVEFLQMINIIQGVPKKIGQCLNI